MSYNLDDVQENFSFTLEGINYVMRYPTTEEVSNVQKLDLDSESKKSLDEQLSWIYPLVTNEKEGQPTIRETLKNINLKKLLKFNQMIKTEFGTEE